MATEAQPQGEDATAAADELGQTSAESVLSGGAWSVLGTVLPPLQTLLISVVAARFLGASGFGQQSLIAFVSLSFVTVFAARMPDALQRFGAQLFGAGEHGAVHWLFRWTWRIQALSAAALIAGFTVYGLALGTPRLAWIAAGVATAMQVMQNGLGGLLASAQRWRDSIKPGVILALGATGVMVAVFALGGGISGYFIVESVMAALSLLWTWRLARPLLRALPRATRISPRLRGDFRSFMRTSTFFALVEFVVLSRVEILFLDHYSTIAQVGFYSVAFAATAAVARIPNVITVVAVPAVASLYGAGEHERIHSGYWRSIRLLAALGPLLAVPAAVLGSSLIGLVYGRPFHAAEPVLIIMLAPYVVLPMMGLSTALLWTLQRLRFLVISGLAAVVADIAFGFILIPRFHAVGAGIDNGIALLVSGVPALWLVARLLAPSVIDYPMIARAVLVAVIMGVLGVAPIVLLGSIPGFLVAFVLTGLGGWLAATRLGVLCRDDGDWLAEVLAGRLGGRLSAVVRRLTI